MQRARLSCSGKRLLTSPSDRFYKGDSRLKELNELAGAGRNRLRFHFVKFELIQQCAAKIRVIREIRGKKKILKFLIEKT